MQSIGEKIRKLRDLRGLSQENIADCLGMKQGGYSKLESGEIELSYSRLEQIAKILKTTVGEIVNFDEERILNNYYNGDGNNTNVNHGNIYHDKLLLDELQKMHEKVISSYELRINDLKSEITKFQGLYEASLKELKTENLRLHEIIKQLLPKSQ
jgi:transcriptional regulator with XRE-family HTH domain